LKYRAMAPPAVAATPAPVAMETAHDEVPKVEELVDEA